MRRREFIAGLGGAAAWPMVARGQQPGKVPRIGILWHAANEQDEAPYPKIFRDSLKELGYVEGKNIELLNRFADEHYDRFDVLAKDLIDAKVDVILASISPGALAAKRISSTTPVVFVIAPDPVGQHLVDSLARPGGNVTGFSVMATDFIGKNLEILKDCLPASSVVLLYNPNGRELRIATWRKHRLRPNSLSIRLSLVKAESSDQLSSAVSAIANQRPDAVLVQGDAMLFRERKRIADLAIENRLPTITAIKEMAEAGALLSYGPDLSDLFRRAALYVDKILKGTKPADLPVEQPTKFELFLNMQTARAIGITIPASVQSRADKIIE